MKKHIPNILTCCNLLSGCFATYFAFHANFSCALFFIIIGAGFDFFDGFVARLLQVSSPLGKELDSLADDITFGFAPAAIVFIILNKLIIPTSIPISSILTIGDISILSFIPYLAFLIAAFSGFRLAKFNIDERQAETFIGLPTPANALFWAALAVGMDNNQLLKDDIALGILILIISLFSCWLLVCETPMFALKFKHFKFKGNELRYSFLVCCIILLIGLGITGFSAIVVLYILTSIMNNLIGIKIVNNE